jgi:uncharacterized protein YfaS (alpha-2-macroglobulin family)
MQFTNEQLKEIWNEGGFTNSEGVFVETEVAEDGEWIDEGKYQRKEYVFAYDGKFYSMYITRYGSYFSYYDYEIDGADEVVKITETVTIERWVTVE